MSSGRKNNKLDVFQCEIFVVFKCTIHYDILSDRVKRAAVVVVVVQPFVLSEQFGVVEQVVFRDGNLSAGRTKFIGSPALISMMARV